MSSVLSSRNFLIQALPFLYSHDRESFAATIAKITVTSSPFLHGSLVPEILMSHKRIRHDSYSDHLVDLLLLQCRTSQFVTRLSLSPPYLFDSPASPYSMYLSLKTLITGRRYFTRQLVHLDVAASISVNDRQLIVQNCLPKLLALQSLNLSCGSATHDVHLNQGLKNLHQLQTLNLSFERRHPQKDTFKTILSANRFRYLKEFGFRIYPNTRSETLETADFDAISDLCPTLENLSLELRISPSSSASTKSLQFPPDLSVMTELKCLRLVILGPLQRNQLHVPSLFCPNPECVDRLFGAVGEEDRFVSCRNLVSLNISLGCKKAFKQLFCHIGGDDCKIERFEFTKFGWYDNECFEMMVSRLPKLKEIDLRYGLVTPLSMYHLIAKHCKSLKRLITANSPCTALKFPKQYQNPTVSQTLEEVKIVSNEFVEVLTWFVGAARQQPRGTNSLCVLRKLDILNCFSVPVSFFFELLASVANSLEVFVGPASLDYSSSGRPRANYDHNKYSVPVMKRLEDVHLFCGLRFSSASSTKLLGQAPVLKTLRITTVAEQISETSVTTSFPFKVSAYFTPVAVSLRTKNRCVGVHIHSLNEQLLKEIKICFASSRCVMFASGGAPAWMTLSNPFNNSL